MVKVLNYGEIKEFKTREKALKFYTECMLATEGAEKERYANIVGDLIETNNDFIYDDEEEYCEYREKNKGVLIWKQ